MRTNVSAFKSNTRKEKTDLYSANSLRALRSRVSVGEWLNERENKNKRELLIYLWVSTESRQQNEWTDSQVAVSSDIMTAIITSATQINETHVSSDRMFC